jgi:hypothetical protein
MMTMLYKTMAPTSHHEKYLKRKKKRKGTMHSAIRQLAKEIQFFLDLKTFILEKASDQSCVREGTIKFPCSSFQPYEGFWRRLSINDIIEFEK